MKQKTYLILIIAALLAAGCNAFGGEGTTAAQPTLDQAAMDLAVSGTVESVLTEIALSQPSSTPEPTATPEPTGTPSETPAPSPTLDETLLEYHANYVEDVTIPDGTLIVGGETFTKTWRIENVGQQTWTTEYTFVFVNGARMEGNAINLPFEVFPGTTVDISIVMIAPLEDGVFTGFWMLSNPDGQVFGFGEDATGAVNVTIDVVLPTPTSSPTVTATPTRTRTPTATP